jgi:DNA-directed RNA polymerase beta subunit
MTIGQIWESVASKMAALFGVVSPMGLPFTPMQRLMTSCDGLHRLGFPRFGREQLYSGVTHGRFVCRVRGPPVTG